MNDDLSVIIKTVIARPPKKTKMRNVDHHFSKKMLVKEIKVA